MARRRVPVTRCPEGTHVCPDGRDRGCADDLEEARAWRVWLLRAAAGDPSALQMMYGVAGERRLFEFTLDWLPGYEGSKPVRVGNAAAEQFQLDVYGEILDALHQGRV